MAGKKDNAIVVVIGDLTEVQSSKLASAIIFQKAKIAPTGKGTIAIGKKDRVGILLQDGQKKICSMENGVTHGK